MRKERGTHALFGKIGRGGSAAGAGAVALAGLLDADDIGAVERELVGGIRRGIDLRHRQHLQS